MTPPSARLCCQRLGSFRLGSGICFFFVKNSVTISINTDEKFHGAQDGLSKTGPSLFCDRDLRSSELNLVRIVDYIVDGLKNTITAWLSQRGRFEKVGAVLPNPVNAEEAYIFHGERYILINIQFGEFFSSEPCRTR